MKHYPSVPRSLALPPTPPLPLPSPPLPRWGCSSLCITSRRLMITLLDWERCSWCRNPSSNQYRRPLPHPIPFPPHVKYPWATLSPRFNYSLKVISGRGQYWSQYTTNESGFSCLGPVSATRLPFDKWWSRRKLFRWKYSTQKYCTLINCIINMLDYVHFPL